MSGLNPFSGLGKIERYLRWNRFRGVSWQQTQKKASDKFGRRWNKIIKTSIANLRQIEGTANRFRQSGLSRDLSTFELPLGQNRSKNVRLTGRITLRDSRFSGGKRASERLFTFDVPRAGSKRNVLRSIREQILDAFMGHYDIAAKYRPDFRRKFGSIDITDIEGV